MIFKILQPMILNL